VVPGEAVDRRPAHVQTDERIPEPVHDAVRDDCRDDCSAECERGKCGDVRPAHGAREQRGSQREGRDGGHPGQLVRRGREPGDDPDDQGQREP
jgi:hypothetical protein